LFHVVTTTNRAGWEQTGRRMAESFLARWPVPLTVYAEDFDPDLPVEVRRLPEWVGEFKAKWGRVVAYTGQYHGRYDYRYDAVKFSHKVGALTDFGLGLDSGVMIWIDADTFTHADVDEAWLDSLLPPSAYMAWLERRNTHPECGFVMFRCDHGYHARFMDAFRTLYTSGNLFKLSETHDSYALQWLAKAKVLHGKIPAPASLSGDDGWHHPFVNGPLGERLDHLKGPRKDEGRSRPRDMRRPRSEPYWTTA
jgi:hypothetical protein